MKDTKRGRCVKLIPLLSVLVSGEEKKITRAIPPFVHKQNSIYTVTRGEFPLCDFLPRP